MKKFYLFFLALCCATIVAANEATIISETETTIETDELGVDTVIIGEDTLFFPRFPEPIHLDLSSSPRKATLAESCPEDSVVGFDVDGNYASKIEYEYEGGREVGKTEYKWVNGVKTGVSRYWKKYTGSTATTTVNYQWNATKGDWDGKDSTQYLYYDNGKMKSNATYAWENGAWRSNTLTEYKYDAAGNQTLVQSSTWNTTEQSLVYTNKFEYEYTNGKRTYYAYWTYSNGTWIGSNKTITVYDGNNKSSEESYSGWADGDWKSGTKNTYTYNADNKVLVQITYNWASPNWVESKKTVKDYEGSNVKDNAVYTWSGDSWVSSSRTSTTWTDGQKTEEIVWKPNGGDTWRYNTKTKYAYSGSNTSMQEPLKWDGTKWIGNGKKWEKTFTGSLVTLYIEYAWGTDDWVYSTKEETVYVGSNIGTQTNSKWVDGNWVGVSQIGHEYDAKNNLIKDLTYAWNGTTWRDSLRTIYVYNSANLLTSDTLSVWEGGIWRDSALHVCEYNSKNVMTLEVHALKSGTIWQATDSMTHVINYQSFASGDKVTFDMQMKWNSTTNTWIGVNNKAEYIYDAVGNQLQSDTYTFYNGAWVNNEHREKTYKNNNPSLVTLEIQMTYTPSTGLWSGRKKEETEYDDSNRQISFATYQWDKNLNNKNGDWKGLTKTETVYTGNQKSASFQYKWDNTTQDWLSSVQYQYSYTNNKLTQQIRLRYNKEKGIWENETLYSYEYDNIHSSAVLTETSTWSNNQWCFTTRNEKSYDSGSSGRLRYELDETYTNCELTVSDMKRYYYSCDTYWNIRFVDWDGTELSSQKILDGATPKTPAKPTREMDKQYTYEFSGWGEKVVAATDNKTYTAQYEPTLRTYTVIFYDENGTTGLDTLKSVAYGTTPVYVGPTPTKEGTAQYSYTFDQWGDNGLQPVNGDTSYVAHYTATVKQYTISFINYDNTPLQSTLVEYGTTPAYTGETPVKPNTDQYTYTFNGWDPAVADVTGIATYTAQFSSSVNQYTVTFYDEDGTTILQQSKWDYDATPAYQKENPTKAGDAQYSYTFAGWGNGIQSVTGDTSYVAKYTQTVNQYTVEFYADEAKTQKLYSNEFYFGSTPAYEGATPTKEGDAQYSYTFAGWGTDGIKTVTADTAYVAQFTQSVNKYTVEFYADEDKTQKLYSNQFEYGATPTYSGETPTKEGDAQYSYTFAGWGTDGLKTVTADTAYIAQFTSSVNKYAITFEVKGNPSLNYTVNDVPYGTVVNDLAELVKAALGNTFEDDNYIYTYAGLEDVTPDDIVTGTATYYVLYTAEPKVISGFDQVGDAARATKVVENGVIYILRDGKKYNLTGAEVK